VAKAYNARMTKTNIGLGCMGMSGMYGTDDDAQSTQVIHAAIERGVTLLDTGDFYASGANELLIGRAIAGRRDKVQLSVKFGALRSPDGGWTGVDGRPAAVKNFLAYSLKRLGTDYVDIYRPARLDPSVPIEETVGAIAEMVKAGFVRQIGLSEVGADTLRRAHAVHPIVDLQIEYSPISRSPEEKVFPTLRELGIGATLYGVMSRGLLTGSKVLAQDFRRFLPRFSAENAAKNATVSEKFGALAQAFGMTPGQLALAYVRAKQPGFTPLVGARKLAQLTDALGALDKSLSPAQVAELEQHVNPDAVAGDRYAPAQMAHLDSER
jgi:aryl-alcohol dehydrogenase-like predicted oxidoreductase